MKTNIFLLVISLVGNLISWQSTGSVNRYTCRSPHFLIHSRCTALRTDITHARGSSHQGFRFPKHSQFITARHVPCFDALYTKHLHSVLSCSGSSIFLSTAKIRYLLKVALLRNCHLLQVMRLTGSSTTRMLVTRRTGTWRKTIRSLNLRIYVSNLCPTTSRFYLQPMTRQKASRRHRNRTSMTNNFVLCWLHHCTYRSDELVQNDLKFITLNEKAWWQVHLKIRQPEVQGNLWVQGNLSPCFHIREGWIKTRFPIETNFPWNINRFLGVTNRFSDSLTGKCCEISSWWKQRSHAYSSEILNL